MLQLNPIYAQGCSKAMMGVVTLNALLAGSEPAKDLPADFGHRYFHEVGGHGEALWCVRYLPRALLPSDVR